MSLKIYTGLVYICVTSGIRFVLVKVNYTGFARKQSEQRSSQRAGRSATRFDLFCFVVKHKPIVEIVYLNHENRATPTLKSSIAIYCY